MVDPEKRMVPLHEQRSDHPDTKLSSRAAGTIDNPDWAVQVFLAAIVDTPHQKAMPLLQERFPGRDIQFYAGVLRSARGLIEELIGGLGKPTDDDPSPTLLDRLSFSWAFLRRR